MTGLEKVTLRYISLIMKANHNLLWVEFVGGDGEERGELSFGEERVLIIIVGMLDVLLSTRTIKENHTGLPSYCCNWQQHSMFTCVCIRGMN